MKALAISVMMNILKTIADSALEIADDIVQALIALLTAMLNSFTNYLSISVDDIPLIGGILRTIGVNDTTTVGHIFCLMGMFPTTFVYQAATTSTAPLFELAASTGVGAADADHVGDALKLTHGVLRVIQGFGDAIADYQAFSDSESGSAKFAPLKFAGYSDSVIGLCVAVVTWPGAKKPDGTTGAPFTTAPPVTNLADRLTLSKWSLATSGPIIGASTQFAKASGSTYTSWAPWVVMVLFGAALGLGLAADAETDLHNAEAYTLTALEITPRFVAPLVLQFINDPADDIPIAVKMFCDAFMEGIAGSIIAADAAEALNG
jgi:hypothetical protein